MLTVTAEISFLAKLSLYEKEKPYTLLPPAQELSNIGEEALEEDEPRTDNLEWEMHRVEIRDLRGKESSFLLDRDGFQVVKHCSEHLPITTLSEHQAYKTETEKLLTNLLRPEFVFCYDVLHRENKETKRTTMRLNDPFLVEGVAIGAHNDCTTVSGPQIIQRYLPNEAQEQFLRPGYRIVIVNTWRPLLPVLEDRPLALCAFSSLKAGDLIPADRIYPDRIGEVYYLSFQPEHEWYYLSRQRLTELLLFKTYDTHPDNKARYCPHVSFDDPTTPRNAPKRRSVETRSIVVFKQL